MSDQSTAITDIRALEALRDDLVNVSEKLADLGEMLGVALNTVHERWSDAQYEEFSEEFKPSRELIDELSAKYKNWATVYIQARIDVLKETEPISFG